jgi:hypothetical protein
MSEDVHVARTGEQYVSHVTGHTSVIDTYEDISIDSVALSPRANYTD